MHNHNGHFKNYKLLGYHYLDSTNVWCVSWGLMHIYTPGLLIVHFLVTFKSGETVLDVENVI